MDNIARIMAARTTGISIVLFNVIERFDQQESVSERNGTYLSGFIVNVGRVRHGIGAVTRRMCPRAQRKECLVLLRNAWRVTQTTLTRPTFWLKQVPFLSGTGFSANLTSPGILITRLIRIIQLALVPHGQNANLILCWEKSIQRDVAGLTVGDN